MLSKMKKVGEYSSHDSFNKHTLRNRVWHNMERHDIARFPRPVYGRVPNFFDSQTAAERLSAMPVFKSAKNIIVGSDKPQLLVRYLVLKQNKVLYVPEPGLQNGILKKITVPADASDNRIYAAARKESIDAASLVNVKDIPKIDLMVVGSVTVSCEGYRIGKGFGYTDLEYAILKELNVIDENTPIVTTVHDTQVAESLPRRLFKAHDVPVNIIVTPARLITIEKPLPKPAGIIWDLLNQEQINKMSILRELSLKTSKRIAKTPASPAVKITHVSHIRPSIHMRSASCQTDPIDLPLKTAADVQLKGHIEGEVAEDMVVGVMATTEMVGEVILDGGEKTLDGGEKTLDGGEKVLEEGEGLLQVGEEILEGEAAENAAAMPAPPALNEGKHKGQRRMGKEKNVRKFRATNNSVCAVPNCALFEEPETPTDGAALPPVITNETYPQLESKRRKRRHRAGANSVVQFSILLRNVPQEIRISDLKAALKSCDVKANRLTWQRRTKRFCLNFYSTNPCMLNDNEGHGVDDVLKKLEGLTFGNADTKVEVEIVKPVSRVETADVSAV